MSHFPVISGNLRSDGAHVLIGFFFENKISFFFNFQFNLNRFQSFLGVGAVANGFYLNKIVSKFIQLSLARAPHRTSIAYHCRVDQKRHLLFVAINHMRSVLTVQLF